MPAVFDCVALQFLVSSTTPNYKVRLAAILLQQIFGFFRNFRFLIFVNSN